MPTGDPAVKGAKAEKAAPGAKLPLKTRKPPPAKASADNGERAPEPPLAPRLSSQPPAHAADAAAAARDCALETAVLLDSIIHDLRTPLSAMSGWLEVLEAHFGEADGIVGRALLGLRRGVDSQSAGLSGLSDVLMKQRIDIPGQDDCTFLERMRLALQELESSPEGRLDPALSARLAPFRKLDAAGSLSCRDAGSSLVEACGTLLRALAAAQDPGDAPLSISADADHVLVTLPGGNGDPTALRSLCVGLAGYPTRRPEIRAQTIWLARSLFRRCGVALQMSPATGGGFQLLLTKAAAA